MEQNSSFATIFDMDGVLLDSPSLNWQAMNTVLADYGVEVAPEQIEKYLGRTLEDQVIQFNNDFGLGLDYEEFKDATDKIKTKLFAKIEPKEGVVGLLESLQNAGVPRAVATSMPRDLTESRLRTAGIFDLFDVIVTADEVIKHKPDPEAFEKAAEKLGVSTSHCVVFEDAPAGVEAAKAAGMKCVAMLTPFVRAEKFSSVDISTTSMSELSLSKLEALFAF